VSLRVDAELVRLAESADAEQLADFLAAAPATWTREHPVVVERVGDAVVGLIPEVPASVLNRVVGLGTAPARPAPPGESVVRENASAAREAA
jgi:hypothetical protein